MTYERVIFIIISVFMLIGCSTNNDDRPKLAGVVSNDDYSLEFTEDLPNERFAIKLTSFLDIQMCVYFEDWPNKNGYLHFASDRVFVTSGGEKFPIKDRNMGVCTGGCYITIPPNGSIESAIPFDEFEGSLPTKNGVKRVLNYSLQPHFCS